MAISKKAKESLNKVVARFESGDLSPIVEVLRIRRHPNDKMPAMGWSKTNQIIAFVQANGEIDSRGFRQWEQVGRKVKKGAKAVYILAPLTFKRENDEGETVTFVGGFRYIPVFPLWETEGDELPEFDYAPLELPPLYDVAEHLGVTVAYGEIGSGAEGWFSSKREHIQLGVHDPATFFHELAHAAHNKLEPLKGGQDESQEVVAEFTAAVLSEMYGIPHSGNAWQYISAYADEPLTAIFKALSTVEKVIDLILSHEATAVQPELIAA